MSTPKLFKDMTTAPKITSQRIAHDHHQARPDEGELKSNADYCAGLERAAKYHDDAARDCDAIAAVNQDNDLGPDCITAAAGGVEVTIITNGGNVPELRLKWDHKEHRDGAVSQYRAAGFDLVVVDMDGDGSWWELKRGKEILAKDTIWTCSPYYHFDAALLAAEAALMMEVRKRIAATKESRP